MESAACLRDVTHRYTSKDFVMSEELYNLLWFFLQHKTAQIEHKQKAPFWADLDEVRWSDVTVPNPMFYFFTR